MHTGWLAAAPPRFITVQKTVAPSPASKCRSGKHCSATRGKRLSGGSQVVSERARSLELISSMVQQRALTTSGVKTPAFPELFGTAQAVPSCELFMRWLLDCVVLGVPAPRIPAISIRAAPRVLLPEVLVGAGNTRGNLTVQRFFPKLRLIRRMGTSASKLRLVALLLGLIFLAAQFHACLDYQAGPPGSHICPICTPGAWAVPAPAIAAPAAGHVARLEVTRSRTVTLASIPLAISPRAPPQS